MFIEDNKDFILIGKIEKEECYFDFIRKDIIVDILFNSSKSLFNNDNYIHTLKIHTNKDKTYKYKIKDREEVCRCKTIISEILLKKELE